jgi:pumilio homology domain family member 6
VPKEERDKLVKELFQIISGRVADFVFKHDSVRVIQTALKYATPEQKKQITTELKGRYRDLAESKYAKFLIAKMVVGSDESRDIVVEEFYGHVKRLIRHPEASWIVDDIYRSLATKQQKAVLLREWYGPDFVLFAKSKNTRSSSAAQDDVTSNLSEILKQNPEKRAPIMTHLHEMTNQLVQKKTTGFTMLHDALLQYFLNCKPGSPEITEFLAMLHDDEEGDLQKNLAFTKSGSRLLCLCLAYGTSKDRRNIMKFFKTHIKLLAADQYGVDVLLTAYDVVDDTVMTSKTIFPELLGKDMELDAREQELLGQVEHLTARIPLLYLMSSEGPKWLVTEDTAALMREVRGIRKETSKKDPEKRRTELLEHVAPPLLKLIADQAQFLAQSSFGCQFITETILGCSASSEISDALKALAALATDKPDDDEKKAEVDKILATPAVGRMLKALLQGGRFDKATKRIIPVEPPLKFHDQLYHKMVETGGKDEVVGWANGPNSFVIVAMLEADDFGSKQDLFKLLTKQASKLDSENRGAAIILEKIGGNDRKADVSIKDKRKKAAVADDVPVKKEKKVKVKSEGKSS